MKKYFFPILLISILPGIAFGASARFTQLVREKQQKMEQLEKCMGASKGLKIAGVSTLGLTAVGVAGNIAEAKMIDSNTKTIAKNTEKIKTAQEDLDNAIKEKNAYIEESAAQLAIDEAEDRPISDEELAQKEIEYKKSHCGKGNKWDENNNTCVPETLSEEAEDCTAIAQLDTSNPHADKVKKAILKDGVCEITECEGNYVPAKDGSVCSEKTKE